MKTSTLIRPPKCFPASKLTCASALLKPSTRPCCTLACTMNLTPEPPRRIVVGISGASGSVYGVRLLQALREIPGTESHLVVSATGWRNLHHELDLERGRVEALAHVVHDADNVGASIASGSFPVHGMVVAPCSMRTLAAIAHGLSDNLLTRAADVMLKDAPSRGTARTRIAAAPGTPAQHGHRDADGRHRLSARAGVLPAPHHGERHRRSQRGAGPRPAGPGTQPGAALAGIAP